MDKLVEVPRIDLSRLLPSELSVQFPERGAEFPIIGRGREITKMTLLGLRHFFHARDLPFPSVLCLQGSASVEECARASSTNLCIARPHELTILGFPSVLPTNLVGLAEATTA
jgi:hypothetical protein